MKKLFIAVMCIGNLCLPINAWADDLGNFIAAQTAANTILAGPGGRMFVFGQKKQKKPKIEHLSNGNIIIDDTEYTPAAEAAARKAEIISDSAAPSAIYQGENIEIKFTYHPGTADVSKADSNNRQANYVTVLATNKSQTKILVPDNTIIYRGWPSIKDNYGNDVCGSVSMLGSSSNKIYPGETKEWKINIDDKLVSTASSLVLSVWPPSNFGNDKSFEINVPLKPAGKPPLVSTHTQP